MCLSGNQHTVLKEPSFSFTKPSLGSWTPTLYLINLPLKRSRRLRKPCPLENSQSRVADYFQQNLVGTWSPQYVSVNLLFYEGCGIRDLLTPILVSIKWVQFATAKTKESKKQATVLRKLEAGGGMVLAYQTLKRKHVPIVTDVISALSENRLGSSKNYQQQAKENESGGDHPA